MFKSIQSAVAGAGLGAAQQSIDDAGIKRIFMVMHGFYGNLFFSKFATGSVEEGEDQGITNARKVWAYSLREYDAETIKGALRRCQSAHPEFPPSLPQFLGLCAAIKPREAYRPPPVPALAMSQELRDEKLAQHRQKVADLAQSLKDDEPESGLDLLKQAVARAFADAGGDEALELLRLDRLLAPAKVARSKDESHAHQ